MFACNNADFATKIVTNSAISAFSIYITFLVLSFKRVRAKVKIGKDNMTITFEIKTKETPKSKAI